MDKVIEVTSPGIWEWVIQFINLAIMIAGIFVIIYIIWLLIKLMKRGIHALDLWIAKNK